MSEQYPDIDAIFMNAIEIESPQEREAYLRRACGDDAQLLARLQKLLAAHFRAGTFLESAAPGLPADSSEGIKSGTSIGAYQLLEQIGEGGMGAVFRAHQTRPVERDVALKIIKLGMDTRQVIARFDAERQALAVMDHPNIAKVFDAGSTETGRPYFVMELVAGVPITEFCDRSNLGIPQRLELFAQVCQAVQHAHQKGLIHRDIKPSNILVSMQDGKPFAKVIDFGIAKATDSRLTEKTLFTEFHQLIGTPEYMSPEQAEGSLDIDTRSDVYSLGVLLYELLVGAPPFDARELRSKAYAEMQRIIREVDPPTPSTRLSTLDALPSVAAHRSTEPRKLRASIRGELDWIVMKAMEKDRAGRYESAASLAADIMHHLADEPVSAGPPSRIYHMRKFVRRNRAAVISAGLIVLLLIGGITGTSIGLVEARKQRDEAQHQRRQAERANQNTQAVNRFLTHDVLGAADPARTQGRQITVKEALDNAAKTVGDMFRQSPLLEASVRNTLALTYEALGHTDLALPHAQAALAVRRRVLGDDHPDTIESVTTLALLLQYQGKVADAEPLYAQAIETSRRVLGAEHPQTLHRLFNMGSLLRDRGEYAEAERVFQEVLQSRRRVLGDAHADTAAAINYLASTLRDQGKLELAEPLNREALENRRQALGDLHPSTLASINDLALVLAMQRKLDEAEPLYREALANYRRVLGDDHPSTMISIHNLGEFLMRRGNVTEAEPLFREAIERSRRVQGPEHPFTVVAMINLGNMLGQARRMVEAEPLLREGLQGCRRAYGEQHPITLRSIRYLTDVLSGQGKFAEAEPLLAELHHKALVAQGDPKLNARHVSGYGVVLVKLGRLHDAEKPLREAYERLSATAQNKGSEMRAVLGALVKVCQATGRPEEAARLAEQLAALEAATRPGAGATAPATTLNR